MRIVFAAGRFNGPTIEHHKLIERVIAAPGDFHYIFIFGPLEVSNTNFKNPFTIQEKYDLLRRLYPAHSHIFVPGDGQHTCTPNQCLSYVWHLNKDKYSHIDISIVAGDGIIGLSNKSQVGGSIGAYQSIIERMNKTKFPSGDYRMIYENVGYLPNPRGSISSRIMREYAIRNDVNNKHHVAKFKTMLHPNIDMFDARILMEKIQQRGYNGIPKAYRKEGKGN